MTFIQPLDLKMSLVNVFAGSFTIFYVLGIILISVLAGRFRMPTPVYVAMIAIYLFSIPPQFKDPFVTGAILILTILVGFSFFIWQSRGVK